jgi:hypothetical protein
VKIFIPSTVEGPDENNHFKQQRDLVKTFIPSTTEGPDEDSHINQ